MVLYATLKKGLHPPLSEPQASAGTALPMWARLLAGAGANIINFSFWYPLNTVLLVQQSELPTGLRLKYGSPAFAEPPRGLLHTGQALLAEGGSARLYRGFGYAMLRAGPVAAVIMPCFEIVLPWLERMSRL